MAGIQTILVIGSIILFTMTTLGFNAAYLQNSTVETENKTMLTAFSLADDMIEEIKVRSFDEKALKFTPSNVSSLTINSELGVDDGENASDPLTFDDIDDFNGYSKLISAPHAEDYFIECNVEYVNNNAPDEASAVQTFYKKVKIEVSSPYMRKKISLSYIITLK